MQQKILVHTCLLHIIEAPSVLKCHQHLAINIVYTKLKKVHMSGNGEISSQTAEGLL